MRLGVLTVGSLYWSDHETREKWRDERLEFGSEIDVKVPIRYGRKSTGRDGTYTIVFSRLCLWKSHGLGIAKAIPCSRDISSPSDIIDEAKSLWAAERKEKNSDRISARWGCVALLPNPDGNIPSEILTSWSKRIDQESRYGNLKHARSEQQIVDDAGILQIPWPLTADDGPLQLDLLLATATNPTLEGDPPTYPRIRKVARAWINDQNDNERYFCNNQKYGIKTYKDQKIKKYFE
jgi:hypothetical protein